jgi:diacylglycerol O-acyltransferase
MDHLSPLDASFLDLEDQDPHASLAIASIAVIDGPVPGQEELIRAIRGRLPLVPRYRQKVRRVPFNLGRPVWVDDPDIDLDYHLRRTALPAPGDDAALNRVVARVMSQRLDRDRPLWEDWVIEGLPDGRWALLSKVHHCLLDGVAGNELYRLMFDTTPQPTGPVADTWQPEPEPDPATLLADAVRDLTSATAEQARFLLGALRSPGALAQRVGETVQGLAAVAGSLTPVFPTSLLGPIGSARRYAVVRTPLPALKDIAKRFGVTMNDIMLAALAGAIRSILIARGERPSGDAVRTLVPVNVRTMSQQGQLANRISLLLPKLPVECADVAERVAAVHERIGAQRSNHEVEAVATMTAVAGYEPFAPVSLTIRAALRLPQRILATVITNVPGPPVPLYVLGRRIREILPYVPIAKGMRLGVSIFTYDGQAVIGVTTDFGHFGAPEEVAAAIQAELSALAAAAPGAQPTAPSPARRTKAASVKPRKAAARGPARAGEPARRRR